MYLLIHGQAGIDLPRLETLHPTMYLLIHSTPLSQVIVFILYIPLCIY